MDAPAYLKNRWLFSTAIFVLLLVAVVALVAWPAWREIRLTKSQIRQERRRLEKLYVRGQRQREARADFDRIKDDLKFLDEIYLPEFQELKYITALEKAAQAAGVTLKIELAASQRAATEPLSIITFNFDVKAGWPSILRWLDAIEQIPYYTNIKELSVAVREDRDGRPVTTASIVADTYWLVN